MNSFLKISSFPLVATLLLVAGCARYKPQPMAFLGGNVKENDTVEIAAKPLTDFECKSYFDRKIVSKGFQPIQLRIRNKSSQTLVLNANDIALPLERPGKVSAKFHKNILKKVLPYGIGSLYMWQVFLPAMVLTGLNSSKANKQLDEDFANRAINPHEQLIIGPHASLNKVIFVSNENFRTDFHIGLVNQSDGSKIEFAM